MVGFKKDAEALKVTETECPSCHKGFTCNAADIKQCQCYGVNLQAADYSYLRQLGFSAEQTGCLCRDCLLSVKEVVKNS